MKTLVNLFAMAAMLALAVADEVNVQGCDIDDPGITRRSAFRTASTKYIACFHGVVSDETQADLRDAKSPADMQRFTSGFCTHAPQVATCLASVRASYETCHNKNASALFLIYADLVEHLLPGACENEGERLAYLVHGFKLAKEVTNNMAPLRRCLHKAWFLLETAIDLNLDIVSLTYLMYQDAQFIKTCVKHVDDEAYKPSVEWLSNEVVSTLKCQHPEEDRLVTCRDVDISKVTTSSICDSQLLNEPNRYDHLEELSIEYCTFYIIPYHTLSNFSLESQKSEIQSLCAYNKDVPYFLVKYSGFAEVCLTKEEDKQFQLFSQSIEDLTEAICEEEGARMAAASYELYRQNPQDRDGLKDCFKTDAEVRKSHQGHAVSSKNMRFYHEMIAFKQCVVDKLHDNNDVSKGMENMINDVLKKMKCVSPEDGNVVLCETIHEH